MRLLLIEDDPLLGRATRKGLMAEGYTVDWVQSGSMALSALQTHDYEALLLDLGLPDMDGHDVLRKIRKNGHDLPILVITARGDIPERILNLDSGADDFIVKPFDLHELAARVRVGLRRARGRSEETIEHGNVTVIPSKQVVMQNGHGVALTASEYKVLLALVSSTGRVLSRDQLEQAIYGWGKEVESNSLEVHIHRLRKKLGKALIETVPGLGYRISASGV